MASALAAAISTATAVSIATLALGLVESSNAVLGIAAHEICHFHLSFLTLLLLVAELHNIVWVFAALVGFHDFQDLVQLHWNPIRKITVQGIPQHLLEDVHLLEHGSALRELQLLAWGRETLDRLHVAI